MKRTICASILGFAVFSASCSQEAPPAQSQENQTACTMEYAPVCAKRGDETKTFGNKCTAEAAGFEVVHPGECGGANAK